SIAGMVSLSQPEQLFAIANLERISRGEVPMVAMTKQLDGYAQSGANTASDPSFPSSMTGGGFLIAGGSNWAGNTINATASDFDWMYDDGLGSHNGDCTPQNTSGCWGHRDNILGFYDPAGCQSTNEFVMGAAINPKGWLGQYPSFAELFVHDCGPMPTDVVFTWAQAEKILHIGNPPPPPPPAVIAGGSLPDGKGYWLVNSVGKVWNFGSAPNLGDLSHMHLTKPIVGIAVNPAGTGFWLVGSDGGIFTFGKVKYHGSEGGTVLNKPIVGIASTADGLGYWEVASDGGIFTFGDAKYHGSEGGTHLNKPVVGMAATWDGKGYWLVAADGGIFTFGDAKYYGSTGNIRLNKPIVGMEAAGKNLGYRFVASDGGIFCFHATFYGSEGGQHLPAPIYGMTGDQATGGYWLVGGTGLMYTIHASYWGQV
ncbi:MAG TPA: hypothetical protein VGS21_07565, partial [Acidimicrobiales bacterium]|nr:hypothetical protein [Acidimicrobiales bacterium]